MASSLVIMGKIFGLPLQRVFLLCSVYYYTTSQVPALHDRHVMQGQSCVVIITSESSIVAMHVEDLTKMRG